MAFEKGNQIWKLRKKDGRNRIFASAEDLWNACVEYFEWVEENPIVEHKPTQFQGEQVDVYLEHKRPMTKESLTIHIGATLETWSQWSKPDHDFSEVCSEVNQIIYDNKFSGASIGLFNASIIARDLGLADKKDHSSTDGSMTPKEAVVIGKDVQDILDNL